VPREQRGWCDREDIAPGGVADEVCQRGELEAIRCFVAERACDLAAQHGVLVSQHERFGILGGVAARQHRRDGLAWSDEFPSGTGSFPVG
jgi:hypothetical protein